MKLVKINKVPAGTFLVPMLLSALVYTIAPNFVRIGGLTEVAFSGDGLNFILGAICLCSGTGIDVKRLVKILKRQGILLVVKFILSILLALDVIALFGQKGIFGISSVALVVALSSINPALYLSLVNEFGKEEDPAAFGLTELFSIPVVPIIVYSLTSSSGSMDWSPVYSTLIPIAIGMLLGNIDKKFTALFAPGVPMLLSQTLPELAPYVTSATAQLLSGVVATSLLTSFLVKRLHSKNTERQANK